MSDALLLDTCALLWLGGSPERFSHDASERIESAIQLYASPMSIWEVANKVAIGKLELESKPQDWFSMLQQEYGIALLPLSASVMLKAAALPFHHKDPADRMIIASALENDLPVVTADKNFPLYGVQTII